MSGDEGKLINWNEAPWPTILEDLVERLEYRRWTFRLDKRDRGQGSRGLTLVITTLGYDAYDRRPAEERKEGYRVNHYMIVPAASYDERSWRRWLFDQVLRVETHEAMEFFKIDGVRPYAPHHGPGNDPYAIFDKGTREDARTMYTGEINDPPYGWCPTCGAPGNGRERRPNGNDVCLKGHSYPSGEAVKTREVAERLAEAYTQLRSVTKRYRPAEAMEEARKAKEDFVPADRISFTDGSEVTFARGGEADPMTSFLGQDGPEAIVPLKRIDVVEGSPLYRPADDIKTRGPRSGS